MSGALQANVYSIQVDNYALSEFFLATPIIRDGSRSFGMPSYHDYLGLASSPLANGKNGGTPLERRINSTLNADNLNAFRNRLKDRLFTPCLNDGYIPQGVAYDPARKRLFISMYYKQVEAADDSNPNNYPSIIVEIFPEEKRMGNVFELMKGLGTPMAAHVGGLLFWKDRLFVPNASQLLVYDISNAAVSAYDPATLTGFLPVSIQPAQTITAPEVFGSVTPFNSIAFLGLRLDGAGAPYFSIGDWSDGKAENFIERSLLETADHVFSFGSSRTFKETNTDAQGVWIYSNLGTSFRAFLSTSGSTRPSKIYISNYTGAEKTGDTGQTGTSSLLFEGPLGFEDLQLVDTRLWTVSESGGMYYQKRSGLLSPWGSIFPFIFSMDVRNIVSPDSAVQLPPPGRITAASGLSAVGSGAKVLMLGFVVPGDGAKQFLIRGVGPALLTKGVPSALAQPTITVSDVLGRTIATNTGWSSNQNASQVATAAAAAGCFALSPGSADSALLVTLPSGVYTAQVSSENQTTGVALAEVYELDSGDPYHVTALSTRAQVGGGAGNLITGIAIKGARSIKVLIRAVGPALVPFGLKAGEVLQNPVLQVFDDQGALVASNTGWSSHAAPESLAAAALAVGDFALPQGSADSALLLTLSPGLYTAHISGAGDSTGIALAEIYQVP